MIIIDDNLTHAEPNSHRITGAAANASILTLQLIAPDTIADNATISVELMCGIPDQTNTIIFGQIAIFSRTEFIDNRNGQLVLTATFPVSPTATYFARRIAGADVRVKIFG